MGARSDKEPLASPRNFFPRRKRRVAELFPKFFVRSFFAFPHFAAVDHNIMRVALSLDLDLAKFHQSCSHDLQSSARSSFGTRDTDSKNPPEQIADFNSRNALNFSSARTMKRLPTLSVICGALKALMCAR